MTLVLEELATEVARFEAAAAEAVRVLDSANRAGEGSLELLNVCLSPCFVGTKLRLDRACFNDGRLTLIIGMTYIPDFFGPAQGIEERYWDCSRHNLGSGLGIAIAMCNCGAQELNNMFFPRVRRDAIGGRFTLLARAVIPAPQVTLDFADSRSHTD